MSNFEQLAAFQPLVLFAVLLVLKMAAVGVITANRRRLAQVVLNPEDVQVNPGSHAAREEAPEVLRAKRAHQNDLENIPAFLVLALLFTLSGASATAGWAYFGTFFVARMLHTVFYLNSAQPLRTMMFFIGQITQLGIMAQLLMKVF